MLKRLFVGLMLAAGLLLLAPVPQASAGSWGWQSSQQTSGGGWFSRLLQRWRQYRESYQSGDGAQSVPELDPSAGGSALVLLIGGAAYIVSRRREDDAA